VIGAGARKGVKERSRADGLAGFEKSQQALARAIRLFLPGSFWPRLRCLHSIRVDGADLGAR